MQTICQMALRSCSFWSLMRSQRGRTIHLPRKILIVRGLSARPIESLSSFNPCLAVPFDYVGTFSFMIRPDSLLQLPLHHRCRPESLWSSWERNCFECYKRQFSFHSSPKAAILKMFTSKQIGYLIYLGHSGNDLEISLDLCHQYYLAAQENELRRLNYHCYA